MRLSTGYLAFFLTTAIGAPTSASPQDQVLQSLHIRENAEERCGSYAYDAVDVKDRKLEALASDCRKIMDNIKNGGGWVSHCYPLLCL
jgi:hypothetical protein